MAGSEVATLAYYITRAGGLGVEDLALNPKSASKNGHGHVRNHAGQIFPEVGMTHVQCPVHRKQDSGRSVEAIPMYLPSTAFNDYITDDMVHNVSESHVRKVVGPRQLRQSPSRASCKSKRHQGQCQACCSLLGWGGLHQE